jgi:hypothetical protein
LESPRSMPSNVEVQMFYLERRRNEQGLAGMERNAGSAQFFAG